VPMRLARYLMRPWLHRSPAFLHAGGVLTRPAGNEIPALVSPRWTGKGDGEEDAPALTRHTNSRINRRPGGRRAGRPPFFDRTGMSCRKIPTRVGTRGGFGLSRPFLLVTFLLARKEKLPGRRRRTEALHVPDTRKAGHARLSGKVDSDPCFPDPCFPK
jgi:hypothetical protein